MKSGQSHAAAGDYNRAILDFKNAAQVMPGNPEPYYQMGLAFVTSGDIRGAVGALRKAVDIAPQHLPSLLKLTEILTAAKDADAVREGQKWAGAALAVSPENPDALRFLATADLRQGNESGAVERLNAALRKDPANLKASLMLAAVRLKNGDTEGAEVIMRGVAEAAPRSAEHAVALGRFYVQTRRPTQARSQFQRALEIDPKYGPALIALADVAFSERNKEEAGRLLQRAAALPDKTYRTVYATFLLDSGDQLGGIAELERLYKKDSRDRDLRTRLIAAYIRARRTELAGKLIAAALKSDANDTVALLQRAEMHLESGQRADAEADAASVLRLKTDSLEAHLLMARIHQMRGDIAGQRKELAESLRIDPGLLVVRIQLAHSLTSGNDAKAALAILDAAPETQRQELAWIQERNTALYALGDYAAMRKGMERGLAIEGHDSELLLQDGLLKLQQHDIAGGRAALEQSLKWNSEDFRALEALAMSYVAEKNVAQATRVVREYTGRLPNSVAAQQFLGMWLARTGDRTGARLAFQIVHSAVSTDSKVAEAADFQLAELDMRDANLDSARKRLLALLKTQPGDLAVLLDLAMAEYRSGRLADAVGYYERVVQLDPNNLAALNNLAFILADTGTDPNRAVLLAQHAKQLAPNDPTLNDTLGWTYYVKGDYVSAVKFMSLNKTMTPKWKCHLAMAYLKSGNRKQAEAMLDAALQQDPSIPEAKRVQAMMAAR